MADRQDLHQQPSRRRFCGEAAAKRLRAAQKVLRWFYIVISLFSYAAFWLYEFAWNTLHYGAYGVESPLWFEVLEGFLIPYLILYGYLFLCSLATLVYFFVRTLRRCRRTWHSDRKAARFLLLLSAIHLGNIIACCRLGFQALMSV